MKVFVPRGRITLDYDFPVVMSGSNSQQPRQLPPVKINIDGEPQIDMAQVVQILAYAHSVAIQQYIIEKEQGIVYGDNKKTDKENAGEDTKKSNH